MGHETEIALILYVLASVAPSKSVSRFFSVFSLRLKWKLCFLSAKVGEWSTEDRPITWSSNLQKLWFCVRSWRVRFVCLAWQQTHCCITSPRWSYCQRSQPFWLNCLASSSNCTRSRCEPSGSSNSSSSIQIRCCSQITLIAMYMNTEWWR